MRHVWTPKFQLSGATVHFLYCVDAFRCADELFNFARSFEKFNSSYDDHRSEDDNDGDSDSKDIDSIDEVSSSSDDEHVEQSDNGTKKAKKQSRKKIPSFSDALLLLCNPDYSLVDAYPTLCRVYAIAVAIPVSLSTAERSFSALKRVKTRIRSSMVQERLESLLLMSIELKILF